MEKIYEKMWQALPGDTYGHKTKNIGQFVENFRAYASTLRPQRDIAADIEAALGKPTAKVAMMHIPIAGIVMLLRHVFQVAEQPDHPLHKDCLAFVQKHKIALVPVPGANGTKKVLSRVP